MPLRLDDRRLGVVGQGGEPGVQGAQRTLPGGVDEHAADHPKCVVARRPRARPVPRKPLVALEDLLDHDPCTAGRGGEPPQVAARVRQPVRMVDAEAVDLALPAQRDQQGVREGEHRRVLDADRHEGVHVEEPAVVELLVAHPPVGQPVVLGVEQLRQAQPLGPRPDREHLFVVAQDRLRPGPVDDQLSGGQALTDAAAEHGHEQRLARHVPLDVEPGGVRRGRAVTQHRPQRQVEGRGRRHRHVVGDDVDHDAHAPGGERADQTVERRRAAEVLGQLGVVDDVVAVGRAGGGLQDGGQVDVADAEGVQVVDPGRDVGEALAGAELQPVGGGRGDLRAASGHPVRRRTTSDRECTCRWPPARVSGPAARPGAAESSTRDQDRP